MKKKKRLLIKYKIKPLSARVSTHLGQQIGKDDVNLGAQRRARDSKQRGPVDLLGDLDLGELLEMK